MREAIEKEMEKVSRYEEQVKDADMPDVEVLDFLEEETSDEDDSIDDEVMMEESTMDNK